MAISYEQFLTVLRDPVARREMGLEVDEAAASELLANDARSIAFYESWSRGTRDLGQSSPPALESVASQNVRKAAPGWYDDGTGVKRYWDGQAWGAYAQVVQAAPKPPSSSAAPVAFGLSLGAFVLGLVPVVGLVLALGAIGTAIFALIDIGKQPKRGAGYAIAAIVIGAISAIWGVSGLLNQAPSATNNQPPVQCLSVSQTTIDGLQWGLDQVQDGLTMQEAAAIRNPSSSTSWFVAGRFTGPGLGDGAVGVWSTTANPTNAPEGIAFVSVDAVAAEFSGYAQPNGYSAALDGVSEVEGCLE